MDTDRRNFLKKTAVAGGALALGFSACSPAREETITGGEGSLSQAGRSLKILILGGTTFTGPHHVRYAIERGHEVTIFTRGRSQPGLFQDSFEQVEHLIGDRGEDLSALQGRSWDAVIDASGRDVEWTRNSAELLRDAAGTYLYISSTGVYYPYLTTEITEDTGPVLEESSTGRSSSSSYGVMKALSEIEVHKAFGDRACVVRPGYIVGPLDMTHRGTYWPERFRRGGEVLVPGKKHDLVQQIDVRDLTEWIVHLLENQIHGVFNATGPASPLTMEVFIDGMKAITSAEVSYTWIEDYEFLTEHNFTFAIPWIMPVGNNFGSQRISVARAKDAGLTYRSIAVTALDTLEWYHSGAMTDEQRGDPPMPVSSARESEILSVWKARASL